VPYTSWHLARRGAVDPKLTFFTAAVAAAAAATNEGCERRSRHIQLCGLLQSVLAVRGVESPWAPSIRQLPVGVWTAPSGRSLPLPLQQLRFPSRMDRQKRVFLVRLDICELLAVPDSIGVFHVKLKAFRAGLFRQHVQWRGFTSDRPVENHRVVWNESLRFQATLMARGSEDSVLAPFFLSLKVKRTIPFGRSTQTVCIGELQVDLAQYAGIEGTHTTHLPLEKSYTTALLRFTLTIRQNEGSRTFKRQPVAQSILQSGLGRPLRAPSTSTDESFDNSPATGASANRARALALIRNEDNCHKQERAADQQSHAQEPVVTGSAPEAFTDESDLSDFNSDGDDHESMIEHDQDARDGPRYGYLGDGLVAGTVGTGERDRDIGYRTSLALATPAESALHDDAEAFMYRESTADKRGAPAKRDVAFRAPSMATMPRSVETNTADAATAALVPHPSTSWDKGVPPDWYQHQHGHTSLPGIRIRTGSNDGWFGEKRALDASVLASGSKPSSSTHGTGKRDHPLDSLPHDDHDFIEDRDSNEHRLSEDDPGADAAGAAPGADDDDTNSITSMSTAPDTTLSSQDERTTTATSPDALPSTSAVYDAEAAPTEPGVIDQARSPAPVRSLPTGPIQRHYRQARVAAQLLGMTLGEQSDQTFTSTVPSTEQTPPADPVNRRWRGRRTQSAVPHLPEWTSLVGASRPKPAQSVNRRTYSRSSMNWWSGERPRKPSTKPSKPTFSLSDIIDTGLDKYVAVLAAEMRRERLVPETVRSTRTDLDAAVADVLRRLGRPATTNTIPLPGDRLSPKSSLPAGTVPWRQQQGRR